MKRRILRGLLGSAVCTALFLSGCRNAKIGGEIAAESTADTGAESEAEAGPETESESKAESGQETVTESDPEESAEPDDTASSDTDYSDEANWAYFGIGEDKDADLFLICPTVDMNDEYNMALDDEATKANFLGALNMERGIYEDVTRMYAPYYRQVAMKVYGLDRAEWEPYMETAYSDVSAAFSYYLQNENDGRPIVLAGFSQGADMCYRLLAEYFGDEELDEQLVAVYAIGWPCTRELAERYPQIRPAASADDLGTVICFDCEAEGVTDTFICPAGEPSYMINPLNWRTDGVPADASQNLGACFTDYSGGVAMEVPGLCGCYVDEDETRTVIRVTDIDVQDYPAYIPGVPEGAYHIYDYQFFFRNLQENVDLRVRTYMQTVTEN